MRRLALAALVFLLSANIRAAEPRSLPRSAPEAQGVSSSALLAFVKAADARIDAMNSVMVVRHGRVVLEGWWSPYHPAAPHSLYSLSKSFTSTAVGLAISEGKLSLDDEVLKFFPDDAPASPSKNLQSMRIRDLLRMATGHQAEPSLQQTAKDPWTKTFLAQPVPFKPGTHFLYNTSATYMLSAIVQKATGSTVLDYLKPRLFDPLGIEQPTWGVSPQGVSLGGYGLNLRTEDIARFGQLLLQKGNWDGKQLVPASWVEEATTRQVANGSNPRSDWDQGYGYQFWRCRHGAFRGDGAFGQYCIVLPKEDTVVAITSGVKDMQSVLDLVWDKLLPALSPASLPPNPEAVSQLSETVSKLRLRTPTGSATAPIASAVLGKTFRFPSNDRKYESIRIEQGGSRAPTIVLRVAGVDQKISCPNGAWSTPGQFAWGTQADQPAAASGAWTDENAFTARICYFETPFYATVRLKFTEKSVELTSESNVGFAATTAPPLVGKLND